MQRIYLCLAHMSGQEQKFIQEAFDTNWVVPLGPNVNGFEADLEAYLQDDVHVSVLSSGTAAIHVGLQLLGVGRGDEVICQSLTFAASANPIIYQGATPVFVDSEPGTWNMDPELMREAIEERLRVTGRLPRAIVVVHLYGMPARMDEILSIADSYGIPVLEDSAESLGSLCGGRKCGTLGAMSVLSFNGNKMITTSGGGALVTHSEALKQRATFLATQAREPMPYYQHEVVGNNYRMSNICAGIGRGQMSVLDEHVAHHRWVCQRYVELLADVPEVRVHVTPIETDSPNYWLSVITFENGLTLENGLLDAIQTLSDADIETRPMWQPMYRQPVFRDAPALVNGVSNDLFLRGLCLPSGPYVKEEQLQHVVSQLKKILAKKA